MTGELAGPVPVVIVHASEEFAGALFTSDESVNGDPSASNRLDGTPEDLHRGRRDDDRGRDLRHDRRASRMRSSVTV